MGLHEPLQVCRIITESWARILPTFEVRDFRLLGLEVQELGIIIVACKGSVSQFHLKSRMVCGNMPRRASFLHSTLSRP